MRFNLFQKSLIFICFSLALFTIISLDSPNPSSFEDPTYSTDDYITKQPKLSKKSYRPLRNVYLAPIVNSTKKIAMILIVATGTDPNDYRISIDSLKCYAQVQGYDFILTDDSNYGCDRHTDKFFRRHCVITKFLPNYQAVFFLDADIGVVNPKVKIEDFLTDDVDVYFYNRFYNWEVATGAYIVKNTKFGMDLIKGFADYEFRLPDSFHGSDNGAFHIYLAELFFPDRKIEIELCRKAYKKSIDFNDLFAYEACIRALYGARQNFGKVRIMKKGDGFIRDDWLAGGTWNPERDFMLHGFKMKKLQVTPEIVPVKPMDQEWWYNPYKGHFDLEKCIPGNTTWSFDSRLIKSTQEVNEGLQKLEAKVAFDNIKDMSRIYELIERKPKMKFPDIIFGFFSWF